MIDMKILIAPNSFKECADSVAIADIFAAYLSRQHDYDIISKPISDGGDGFLGVCENNFELEKISYRIPTPYSNRQIKCEAGYSKENKKLFIESADAVGLKLIPPDRRHPLYLSTKGLGVLIKQIAADVNNGKIEADKVIIGIGGTGTNDLGIGALSELGMKLEDKHNKVLEPVPINFNETRKILWKAPKLPFKIELVTDVNNPLLGKEGASYIYGSQKGLTTKEIKIADAGFENIIRISEEEGIIQSTKFISGAGGGLAAGFQLFIGAKLILSDKFISRELGIMNNEKYSAVITAEGAFDNQSFMNKATGTIIKKYAGSRAKIFLVCGKIDKSVLYKLPVNVCPIEIAKYFISKTDSIKHYKKGIKLACQEILTKLLLHTT